MKIVTDYLVSLLGCIDDMPRAGFQPESLVEHWKASGRTFDDRFILHYEVLFDYAFLVPCESPSTSIDGHKLMEALDTPESSELLSLPRVKLSASGREFLLRHGE
ncbi:MAG: hypothetical protein KTR32_05935 [Granulosicoccus sp.]|nr:hypothetical protein [Granulosicoccus sp.]